MEKWPKLVAAVAGAVSSYLFGGWTAMLGALVLFAAIDYVSGFIAAALAGQLSSAVGMRGIAKKVAMFAVVAVAHQVDRMLGEAHLVRDAALWWYLANELLSVIENMGKLGVPIPPPVKQAVAVLNGKAKAS